MGDKDTIGERWHCGGRRRREGAMESSGTTFPFYLSIRIPGVDECSNYKLGGTEPI
jgi:hypothetical protein